MVRLIADDDFRLRTTFCFRSMEDCNRFKSVFENHWCNVKWLRTEEADSFPEATDEYLDKDPVKRAEENLSWGFSLTRRMGTDGLTSEQKAVIDMIMGMTD